MRCVIKDYSVHVFVRFRSMIFFQCLKSSCSYIQYIMTAVQSLFNTPEVLTLCLGPIGMDCVISEPCYKGTILQRIIGK